MSNGERRTYYKNELEMSKMTSVEDAIKKIEMVYQTLTGCEPPPSNGAYAPIPPEADLVMHVEAQLTKLMRLMENPKPIPQPTWSPSISLWEDEKELVIEMELAGISQSGVEIATLQRLVTISGDRAPLPSGRHIWVNERSFGPFCRTLLLPPYIDTKSMQVVSDEGVLQLRFSRLSPGLEPRPTSQN